MTTGFVKYITTLFFAAIIMLLVVGLACEAQKVWKYGWIACVLVLLAVLLVLLGFGDSKAMEHNLQKCIARYHARKTSGQAKHAPVFGNPEDLRYFDGDDRPLPASLTHRIAVYTQSRRKKDPVEFKNALSASSSFNALVRQEMRAGRL